MESINKIRLASNLDFDSIVDGLGLRIVIWTQGCPHQCLGCHNPQTHAMQQGFTVAITDIIEQIQASNLQNGVTFSGGEPFLQAEALIPIAKAAHKKELNVWAYSGFTFEQLLKDQRQRELLENIDVLVDGKFILALKNYQLHYKGSTNQRIIDVPKSLKSKNVILHEAEEKNRF